MTIEERVAELVAKAPPLTEEERARLRQLLLLVPSHGRASVRTGSKKGLIRRRDEVVVTDPVMGRMMAGRGASNSDGSTSGSSGPGVPLSASNKRSA